VYIGVYIRPHPVRKIHNFLYPISELFWPIRKKSAPWIEKNDLTHTVANRSWLHHCSRSFGLQNCRISKKCWWSNRGRNCNVRLSNYRMRKYDPFNVHV